MATDTSKLDQVYPIGDHVCGFLMFDSGDHFLIVITRSGLPKSPPNAGQTATDGEKTPILQRSIACFGTDSINDADQTISVHIEGSTSRKWTGTDQQRRFTLACDELKWTNALCLGRCGNRGVGLKTRQIDWPVSLFVLT